MFLPENFSSGKSYSEERAAQIDGEISTIIEEAHTRVRGILSERRKVLDDLAHLLLEKEVVPGEELREMLSKSKTGFAAPRIKDMDPTG
jgi:cell division protease FtsH